MAEDDSRSHRPDGCALWLGDNIKLESSGRLVVHRSQDPRVVILEYEVHGKIVATGVPYDNRFVSIITIENKKIVHWEDYMDSFAAWLALNRAPSVTSK
jgi:uncharacterized protein